MIKNSQMGEQGLFQGFSSFFCSQTNFQNQHGPRHRCVCIVKHIFLRMAKLNKGLTARPS